MDDASTSLILGKPLHILVDETLKSERIEGRRIEYKELVGAVPSLDGDFVLVRDNLFFTRNILKRFIEEAMQRNESSCLAIPDSLFTKLTSPLQNLRRVDDSKVGAGFLFDLYFIRRKDRDRIVINEDGIVDGVEPLFLKLEEETWKVENIPKTLVKEGEIELPATSQVVMRLEHWVHILRANQLALMALAMEEKERFRRSNRLVRAIRGLSLLLKGRNLFDMMRLMTRRGKRCLIHPTARVEASILEDGVRVGAFAMVRGSYISEGARIDDYAQVYFSVVGRGATVSRMAQANFCVLYPDAFISHIGHQACLIGREAFTSQEMAIYDMKMGGGDVNVEYEGRRVPSGSPFLGACIGHRTKIGAGVFVNYGVAVPNDLFIVGGADRILRSAEVPEGVEPGTPLFVKDGKLCPIR